MEIKTVGECFYQIRNGANIKQDDADGGYPITRIETTANDKFNRDRMGYAGITDISKYQSYVLEDGDLLMSHINSVQYLGRTVLYEKQDNEQIIHGMNLLGLKANRSIAIPAYARYFFYSHYFRDQISNITKKSVNQASFSVADLKKLKMQIPPLEEQKNIAETLDKANRVIALRRQELQKLDELIKARFVEMFGDVKTNNNGLRTAKGSELFKFSSGKFLPEEKRLKSGVPVYGGNGIAWYTEKELIDYPTIIIGRVGAQCGNIHNVNEPVWITDNAIFIKEQKTDFFTLEFLSEMMTVMDFSQYADFSGQPKITQKPLENVEYLIPSKDEQNQYSAFCKQVNKSKVVVQKALDEAQLLFDSLMQKYFG